MVAGDVVSEIGAVASTLTFQPAATIECLISTVSGGSTTIWTSLTNAAGVITAYLFSTNGTSSFRNNSKLFINNTNYLYIYAPGAGEYATFTGIQIK
jgi:hypothetical protein